MYFAVSKLYVLKNMQYPQLARTHVYLEHICNNYNNYEYYSQNKINVILSTFHDSSFNLT